MKTNKLLNQITTEECSQRLEMNEREEIFRFNLWCSYQGYRNVLEIFGFIFHWLSFWVGWEVSNYQQTIQKVGPQKGVDNNHIHWNYFNTLKQLLIPQQKNYGKRIDLCVVFKKLQQNKKNKKMVFHPWYFYCLLNIFLIYIWIIY
jgi:hypothetical protein